MTDDIVTRLRANCCPDLDCISDYCEIEREAANEIEQLRQLGDAMADVLDQYSTVRSWDGKHNVGHLYHDNTGAGANARDAWRTHRTPMSHLSHRP